MSQLFSTGRGRFAGRYDEEIWSIYVRVALALANRKGLFKGRCSSAVLCPKLPGNDLWFITNKSHTALRVGFALVKEDISRAMDVAGAIVAQIALTLTTLASDNWILYGGKCEIVLVNILNRCCTANLVLNDSGESHTSIALQTFICLVADVRVIWSWKLDGERIFWVPPGQALIHWKVDQRPGHSSTICVKLSGHNPNISCMAQVSDEKHQRNRTKRFPEQHFAAWGPVGLSQTFGLSCCSLFSWHQYCDGIWCDSQEHQSNYNCWEFPSELVSTCCGWTSDMLCDTFNIFHELRQVFIHFLKVAPSPFWVQCFAPAKIDNAWSSKWSPTGFWTYEPICRASWPKTDRKNMSKEYANDKTIKNNVKHQRFSGQTHPTSSASPLCRCAAVHVWVFLEEPEPCHHCDSSRDCSLMNSERICQAENHCKLQLIWATKWPFHHPKISTQHPFSKDLAWQTLPPVPPSTSGKGPVRQRRGRVEIAPFATRICFSLLDSLSGTQTDSLSLRFAMVLVCFGFSGCECCLVPLRKFAKHQNHGGNLSIAGFSSVFQVPSSSNSTCIFQSQCVWISLLSLVSGRPPREVTWPNTLPALLRYIFIGQAGRKNWTGLLVLLQQPAEGHVECSLCYAKARTSYSPGLLGNINNTSQHNGVKEGTSAKRHK